MTSIADKIKELEDRCFDLVWYARANPEDTKPPLEIQQRRAANIGRIEAKYAKEVAQLAGDDGAWQHGFNSGALAIVRLLRAYALPDDYNEDFDNGEEVMTFTRASEIEQAEEEFPMLDS
jgi:hypothetical protein